MDNSNKADQPDSPDADAPIEPEMGRDIPVKQPAQAIPAFGAESQPPSKNPAAGISAIGPKITDIVAGNGKPDRPPVATSPDKQKAESGERLPANQPQQPDKSGQGKQLPAKTSQPLHLVVVITISLIVTLALGFAAFYAFRQ